MLVSDVVLNNTEYFVVVYKHTTTRMPATKTGTWFQTANPSFGGTWNIIADGTIVSPNAENGEGITSVLITRGGSMYMDKTMETFGFPCFGETAWIPTIGHDFSSDAIFTLGQTTTIGAHTATWNLIADLFGMPYLENDCDEVSSGTWSWNGRVGEIYVD